MVTFIPFRQEGPPRAPPLPQSGSLYLRVAIVAIVVVVVVVSTVSAVGVVGAVVGVCGHGMGVEAGSHTSHNIHHNIGAARSAGTAAPLSLASFLHHASKHM